MCGIAGILSAHRREVHENRLRKMAGSLAHRGPDGEGVWINGDNTTGFAHRRLSIIDLSAAAAQPMHFADRFTIVYNGEIFNYKELKTSLEKHGFFFNTKSDTEVILAAYQHYGIECLKHLDGMFAMAIWDDHQKELLLARDRFGEKPLYYAYKDDALFFASEMKALWSAGIGRKLNYAGLLFFATTGLAELPTTTADTYYEEICELPPAHYALLRLEAPELQPVPYFHLKAEVQNMAEKEAIDMFRQLLIDSVDKRLRSDVEVGASLSGGIDSSVIALLASLHCPNNSFKTFSGVFPGFEKDESDKINLVAQTVNLQSFQTTPTAADLFSDINKMLYHQEAPIGSSSVFLQYKVYELAAKNGMKVLLDGQGADESLGGYEKFIPWHLQEMITGEGMMAAKKEYEKLISNGYRFTWDLKNFAAAALPALATKQVLNKARSQVSNNKIFTWEFTTAFEKKAKSYIEKSKGHQPGHQLHHALTVQGLPELLRYADRNSMAFGTELRLPFLQHNLVQFIFSLPSSLKICQGYTKFILRKSFDKKLPDDIIWQGGKTGFEPPQKAWLASGAMQELMKHSISKLTDLQIVVPGLQTNELRPAAAHDRHNEAWRLLMLERLLNP